MRTAKGFFLLQAIIIFTLSLLLMLATLRIYRECYFTLQQKLLLEQAFTAAQNSLANKEQETKFTIISQEQNFPVNNLNLKELQISYHDKTLLTMVEVR